MSHVLSASSRLIGGLAIVAVGTLTVAGCSASTGGDAPSTDETEASTGD